MLNLFPKIPLRYQMFHVYYFLLLPFSFLALFKILLVQFGPHLNMKRLPQIICGLNVGHSPSPALHMEQKGETGGHVGSWEGLAERDHRNMLLSQDERLSCFLILY